MIGGEEVHTVRHYVTGGKSSLSVLPTKGARLHHLQLTDRGKSYTVIDHRLMENGTTGERYGGAPLIPFANRIAEGRYQFKGLEYSLPTNDNIRGHAIHGLVYDKPFVVTQQQVTPAGTSVELRYEYPGQAEGYPFPFVVRVFYRLDEGGLRCNTSVTNVGAEAMPLTFGWHPYLWLARGIAHWQMKLPTCQLYETDPGLIPTGEKRPFFAFEGLQSLAGHSFNTTFALLDPSHTQVIQLYCPSEGHQINLWVEGGTNQYNHFHLYTPAEEHWLAVEPMTGASDAFNSGGSLLVLQSRETVSAAYGISYRFLPNSGS